MSKKKDLELHIPSVLGEEKIAMEAAAKVAREMGFSEDRIEDLKTAVSEACCNAIEHGNQLEKSSKVGISLSVEDEKLRIAVRDKGRGIRDASHPDIEKKVHGEQANRGWGMFLIESLVNEVKFESGPDDGNVVHMVICLDK